MKWFLLCLVMCLGAYFGRGYLEEIFTDVLDEEEAVYEEVNQVREAHGLLELARYESIDRIARSRSEYMMEHGLSHEGFDGRANQIMNDNFTVTVVAENVLESQGYNAHSMVQAWYDSFEHRTNMLGSIFCKCGVGIAVGNGKTYTTQIFTD